MATIGQNPLGSCPACALLKWMEALQECSSSHSYRHCFCRTVSHQTALCYVYWPRYKRNLFFFQCSLQFTESEFTGKSYGMSRSPLAAKEIRWLSKTAVLVALWQFLLLIYATISEWCSWLFPAVCLFLVQGLLRPLPRWSPSSMFHLCWISFC